MIISSPNNISSWKSGILSPSSSVTGGPPPAASPGSTFSTGACGLV